MWLRDPAEVGAEALPAAPLLAPGALQFPAGVALVWPWLVVTEAEGLTAVELSGDGLAPADVPATPQDSFFAMPLPAGGARGNTAPPLVASVRRLFYRYSPGALVTSVALFGGADPRLCWSETNAHRVLCATPFGSKARAVLARGTEAGDGPGGARFALPFAVAAGPRATLRAASYVGAIYAVNATSSAADELLPGAALTVTQPPLPEETAMGPVVLAARSAEGVQLLREHC